ncbi:MAG: hypothetical protein HOA57_01800 [Candidatus Magasanikbacteria bacterium]|jgi:phosphohistidine swiveling domain-containing protein|nr:hypothetical protein [Candidatus Magasanikbacteria bacterium]MBT4315155.1 hypothetical protein [Candidatus Magasanikbacteria bacterium]MBT4547389.1 hypothetical protein [Candidatus Magasanikbacteria bacterium]MBT6819088.1 hypothetical protein [Candidatus Magasanikbacteria bacterium]
MNRKKIMEEKMPSLTEWLEKIKFEDLHKITEEDETKWKRLGDLHSLFGLKTPNLARLSLDDILDKSKNFRRLLKNKKYKNCTWRIIPKNSDSKKMRIRGKTFKGNVRWFNKQNFDCSKYNHVELIPHHKNTLYSGIFVVTGNSVWGEIIKGELWQLAYGLHKKIPFVFPYNFFKKTKGEIYNNKKIYKIVLEAMRQLEVEDENTKEKLRKKYNAKFTEMNHLKGYFEFVVWPKNEVVFMEYSPLLYERLKKIDFTPPTEGKNLLTGMCGCPGEVVGNVQIVRDPNKDDFEEDDIMVSKVITKDFLPLLKKAKAIITEQGNILSHFSIVSRELNIPHLVLVKGALRKLKNGDRIKMDAKNGIIKILKNEA